MKKTHFVFIIILSLYSTSLLYGQIPARKGWWKFDDANNVLKADSGASLELVGTHQTVAGPAVGNGAVKIGIGSYYKIKHGMFTNGGGTGKLVNEYTLLIDFKVPSIGTWKTFFQTDVSNTNDGDCFINTTGNIGTQATGYSSYSVLANEWYRLVVSIKNGTQHNYYLDGQAIKIGTTSPVDGRFALDSLLLLFADNDGDDGEIECAEVAIWNSALSVADIVTLGGYGHNVGPKPIALTPYLQTPSPTSVYVCWHDTSSSGTSVEYGTTSSFGSVTVGTSEIVSSTYRWHTVLLTGLTPNMEYSYKVKSGANVSEVFKFKTQPAPGYTGKLRFLLFSDTHNYDTSKTMNVMRAAKNKITELYGADMHNQINAVLHSGDLVIFGRNVDEYSKLFFAPMSVFSKSIPVLAVPGNHDRPDNGRDGDAGPNYYAYVKYDSISLIPSPNPPSERFWSARFANTLVIGLNTDVASTLGPLQKVLLDLKLAEAQADSTIDFVLCIHHHMPYTELWGEGIGYDPGPNYVRDELLPVFQKYSKVVQLTYGHTHGFERGTIESNTNEGDFRIVCNGGAGGNTDRWGAFLNFDYPFIHVSLDHFFYQIIEIDVAKKTFVGSMYSIGNSDKVYNNELLDTWYRKAAQVAPAIPSVSAPTILSNKLVFNSSAMSGPDSIMTTRMQIAYDTSFSQIAVDTMVNWKDVYGADAQFNAVDKNAGIDLTKLEIPKTRFAAGKLFYYRVKYRDHNLRWSDWSNRSNSITGVAKELPLPTAYGVEQNYPNPFNPSTTIKYQVPVNSFVTLKIYDVLGKEISVLQNGMVNTGRYEVQWNGSGLTSGVYYYFFTAQKEDKSIYRNVNKAILLK